MTELSGASIVVVGASGGLGSRIAKQLAAQGANLTLTGRNEAALHSLGIPGAVVVADVTVDGDRKKIIDHAVASNGGIDGVVYAAGAVAFGPASELEAATLDQLWAINTRGAIMLLQEASASLQASAGAGRQPFFVTLSGVVAEAPTAGLAAYSAVKSALHAHMAAASREMRRVGIRLLDARPGHTETDLSHHPLAGQRPAFPAGMSPDAVAERIVQGIIGEEKDLASGAFSQTG